jgi:hypothetical protein
MEVWTVRQTYDGDPDPCPDLVAVCDTEATAMDWVGRRGPKGDYDIACWGVETPEEKGGQRT